MFGSVGSAGTSRSTRPRLVGVTCLLGVAALTAACGSSSKSSTASPSTAAPTASSAAPTTAGGGSAPSGNAQVVNGIGANCTGTNTGKTLKGMLVGFSQSEALSNPFRAVETSSVEDSLKAAGAQIAYTNANADPAKQLNDIQDLLAKGVNALVVAPENATGLESVLAQAQSKGVPVFLIDRDTAPHPLCSNGIITFAGSNFTQQGQRACTSLVQAMGGNANMIELDGTPGNLVASERAQGCADVLKSNTGMHLVAEQTGNFTLSGGESVTAQLIQAHPDVNAIYAHNDEMALGAITALSNAGKTPGKDVKIVSIDGVKAIIQDVIDGKVVSDVETNPRFGPLVVSAINGYLSGQPVNERLVTQDAEYTSANAASLINTQGY